MVKFLGYGWSAQRSLPALRDQVHAALAAARFAGWDGPARRPSGRTWTSSGTRADVEVEGDPEVQQAVRFALFHVLQAGARAERRPIAAKGLTGPGYDGHTFWDTEMFALPVLTYTWPAAAADVLRWRHATLDLARERAADAGPARRGLPVADHPRPGVLGVLAGRHRGVPHRRRHRRRRACATSTPPATRTSPASVGVELLVETARLWRSLGHHDRHGRFHIDGVTGPDEYSALADDNVYTNLMAARNLRRRGRAGRCATRTWPRPLGVGDEEAAVLARRGGRHARALRRGAGRARAVRAASPGTRSGTSPAPRPRTTRCCCTARTSTCTASRWSSRPTWCWRCTGAATRSPPEQKARNFAYYEARTVRDSSLSACTQAVLAAEVGHLELAHDYLAEAALMDLRDLNHNTRDGVHIASLAGAWLGAGRRVRRHARPRRAALVRAAAAGPDRPARASRCAGAACGCGSTVRGARRPPTSCDDRPDETDHAMRLILATTAGPADASGRAPAGDRGRSRRWRRGPPPPTQPTGRAPGRRFDEPA